MCLRTEMFVYRGELKGSETFLMLIFAPQKIASPREHCTSSKLFTSDKKM